MADVETLRKGRPNAITRTKIIRDYIESWAPSLFSAEQPDWGVEKRLISAAFSHARVSSSIPTIHKVAQRFADVIAVVSDDDDEIAINGLCQRFTLDVIALLAFGQDLHQLSVTENDEQESSEAAVVIPKIFKKDGRTDDATDTVAPHSSLRGLLGWGCASEEADKEIDGEDHQPSDAGRTDVRR